MLAPSLRNPGSATELCKYSHLNGNELLCQPPVADPGFSRLGHQPLNLAKNLIFGNILPRTA